jgi:hypothetical protein
MPMIVNALISAAGAALAITPGPAPRPSSIGSDSLSPTLAQASSSLIGKRQCVAFTWLPNDKGSPRGGISVPVRINDQTVPLQLDTGANVTSVYGSFPIKAGWAAKGSETFRAKSFELASAALDRPQLYLNPNMEDDASLRGTLGLPALLGRIAVIDYPKQRFCLFDEADLPAPIQQATFVRAMLRNAKFHVPIKTGAFESDTIVFDTGSSECRFTSTWPPGSGSQVATPLPAPQPRSKEQLGASPLPLPARLLLHR